MEPKNMSCQLWDFSSLSWKKGLPSSASRLVTFTGNKCECDFSRPHEREATHAWWRNPERTGFPRRAWAPGRLRGAPGHCQWLEVAPFRGHFAFVLVCGHYSQGRLKPGLAFCGLCVILTLDTGRQGEAASEPQPGRDRGLGRGWGEQLLSRTHRLQEAGLGPPDPKRVPSCSSRDVFSSDSF